MWQSDMFTFLSIQDFPYNFDDDVEHHNIWSTVALQEADILKVRSALAASKSKTSWAGPSVERLIVG